VKLLESVGDEPVFDSAMLLVGPVNPASLRVQLSRWVAAGKLIQIRRELYAPAPPYQKVKPHPFFVANRLVPASYVSCQSALAYYGLIPEYAAATTSVTTARPSQWDTSLGRFVFQHLKREHFNAYRRVEVSARQSAFVATPEKALLDLIYLQPHSATRAYAQGLRLQNLERVNWPELQHLADASGRPKLRRAAKALAELAATAETFETL